MRANPVLPYVRCYTYVQSIGFGNALLDMAPSDESRFTVLVESEG